MILEKDILLWNEEDDISLFDDKGNRFNNLFKSNPRLQYAIIANDLKIEPCNTLRERGSEFDLIKIDVEGSELWVLQGAEKTIKNRTKDSLLRIYLKLYRKISIL